jgi:membrane protease YdiL (CAAX protease family)
MFLSLWALCIIGSLSVLPYIYALGIIPSSAPLWRVILSNAIQSAILFGLVCWLSSKLIPKTDLRPFISERPLKRIVYPAIFSGLAVGLALFIFDKTIFGSSLLSGIHPPFWAGALASLYGGVNEEVLLRLFLFTFIYFVISKLFRFNNDKRIYVLWTTNVLVSLAFGAGHLPAAFKMISPSGFEIFRVFFLNGFAGLIFGWLFWSRGIWAAIGAHFVADLMFHVFLI